MLVSEFVANRRLTMARTERLTKELLDSLPIRSGQCQGAMHSSFLKLSDLIMQLSKVSHEHRGILTTPARMYVAHT